MPNKAKEFWKRLAGKSRKKRKEAEDDETDYPESFAPSFISSASLDLSADLDWRKLEPALVPDVRTDGLVERHERFLLEQEKSAFEDPGMADEKYPRHGPQDWEAVVAHRRKMAEGFMRRDPSESQLLWPDWRGEDYAKTAGSSTSTARPLASQRTRQNQMLPTGLSKDVAERYQRMRFDGPASDAGSRQQLIRPPSVISQRTEALNKLCCLARCVCVASPCCQKYLVIDEGAIAEPPTTEIAIQTESWDETSDPNSSSYVAPFDSQLGQLNVDRLQLPEPSYGGARSTTSAPHRRTRHAAGFEGAYGASSLPRSSRSVGSKSRPRSGSGLSAHSASASKAPSDIDEMRQRLATLQQYLDESSEAEPPVRNSVKK